MKKEKRRDGGEGGEVPEKEQLPNPMQAAIASALAFSVGAVVPLLASAFIRGYKMRLRWRLQLLACHWWYLEGSEKY